MKKAAVATTTASGAAVSSRRMTAVQSVYIAAGSGAGLNAGPSSQQGGGPVRLLLGVLGPLVLAASATAGVVFENCQTAADGSISCDTRPTGGTLMDDEAARYGLFDEASPGWAEFDPYEGYDDMVGGNWT
ncbi:MAG: hypothetical protein ACKO7Z_05095 [Cyanobacteriota bacterium]